MDSGKGCHRKMEEKYCQEEGQKDAIKYLLVMNLSDADN